LVWVSTTSWGGGVPEFSFSIIAGGPVPADHVGHQIAFANASPANPRLYFTIQANPHQDAALSATVLFFRRSKTAKTVRYINLSDV